MVCGRPAAGERGGFAAEEPVSASGSEITTVLPVFAPPEPVGVPAPATATDRTVERSLAGVAPGSQLGWADRPPAPGGADSSPPWDRADPPPAPGSSVKSSPPWEQAGQSPAPGVVKSGPPWEQADQSPASRAVKSGPPWDRAEPSPAPGGTGASPEGIIPRQSGSGRHRSRRA